MEFTLRADKTGYKKVALLPQWIAKEHVKVIVVIARFLCNIQGSNESCQKAGCCIAIGILAMCIHGR
jgi:hypothetical protein